MPLSRSRLEVFRRSPLDNDNALVGWWPLDNDASDVSGTNNVGTLVGSPPLVPGPGRAMGISLNGSSQRVETTTNFGNASTLSTVSISAWFKTSTAGGKAFLMLNQSQDGSSGTGDRGLYIGTDGKVYGYVFDSVGSAAKNAVSSATYTDGLWHHAVTTIQAANSIKLYVDGVFQQSTAVTTPFVGYPSSFWVIGRNGATSGLNSAAGFFTGSVFDAKVYQYRVLDPGEISAEYNRTLAGYALRPDEWEMPALYVAPASPVVSSRQYIVGPGVYVSETGTRSYMLAPGVYVTERISAVTAPAIQYAAFSLPQHSLSQVIQKMVGY